MTLLLADTAIAGQVGGRINYGATPQTEPYPRIVLSVISDVSDYHMSGDSGYHQSRVQIDIYSQTYAAASAIGAAVMACLSGARFGSVMGCFADGLRTSFEAPSDHPQKIHRRSIDFILHHGASS